MYTDHKNIGSVIMYLDYYKNNIVKIQCKDKNGQPLSFGTGFALTPYLILTIDHVLVEDNNTIYAITNDGKEYVLTIDAEVEKLRLLRSKTKIHTIGKNLKLTEKYVCHIDDCWETFGYIGENQVERYITGKGLIQSGQTQIVIQDIQRGDVKNFRGLSGSPAIVDNMIIGIVEEQIVNSKEAVAIRIVKINEVIKNNLSHDLFSNNICVENLKKGLMVKTESEINKNISNRKYIPEIFVEENNYKEMIRYFADPILFIAKSIHDILRIDLTDINLFLEKYKLPKMVLDVNIKMAQELTVDNYKETTQNLIHQLQVAIDMNESFWKAESDIAESELNSFLHEKSKISNTSIKFLLDDIKRNLEYCLYTSVVLTKNAGQGKTNFICDFTRNFLLKKGYLCLYLNAYDFNKSPSEYIDELLCSFSKVDINKTYRYLEQSYKDTGRPFVIVIDGLNENTYLDNLSSHISDLCNYFSGCNFVKLIMTTRNELYEEKFQAVDSLGVYRLNMTRYNNDTFAHRIFYGYLDHFDITIREYTLFETTFENLSKDTLLLRFFCEANKGQKNMYMYDIYMYSLFEKYHFQKINELKTFNKNIIDGSQLYNSILNKMIEYMIEHSEYRQVPIEIFTPQEQELLYHLLFNDIVFKDEQKITKGLLSSEQTVISFTFDEFRDFCMTKYLAENWNVNQIAEFLNKNKETTIFEGISKYLFFISKLPTGKPLNNILKQYEFYNEIYWNNIFNVEDKYIKEEDIDIIINSFTCYDKPRQRHITSDLLFKHDLSYYKNLNINHLYSIMDKLNEDEFKTIFKPIFYSYHSQHSYDYYYDRPNPPLISANKLIMNFTDNINNENMGDFFKISIYLYDFARSETVDFWVEYLKKKPNQALEFLQAMNNCTNNYINSNIKYLLSSISAYDISGNVNSKIKELNEENCFIIPKTSVFDIFRDILEDDYEDL